MLFIKNRSGNRPSQEGAAPLFDRAIGLCKRAGFRRIALRGDCKFSQTEHLDRWNDIDNVFFYFGYESRKNLERIADELPENAWQRLKRRPRYQVKTAPRRKRRSSQAVGSIPGGAGGDASASVAAHVRPSALPPPATLRLLFRSFLALRPWAV